MIEIKENQIDIKSLTLFEPVQRKQSLLFDPGRDISGEDWKELGLLLLEATERDSLHAAGALAFLNKHAGRAKGMYASWYVDSLAGHILERDYGIDPVSYLSDIAYMHNISPKKADEIKASKHDVFERAMEKIRNIGISLGDYVALNSAYPEKQIKAPDHLVNSDLIILNMRLRQFKELSVNLVRQDLIPDIFNRASSLKLFAPEKLDDVQIDEDVWQVAHSYLKKLLDRDFYLDDPTESKVEVYAKLAMNMTILAADIATIDSDGIKLTVKNTDTQMTQANVPVIRKF